MGRGYFEGETKGKGMTETHALGTMCTFRSVVKDREVKYKQGRKGGNFVEISRVAVSGY